MIASMARENMRGESVRKPVLLAVLASIVLVLGVVLWLALSRTAPERFLQSGARTHVLFVAASDSEPPVSIFLVSAVPDEDAAVLSIPTGLWLKQTDGVFARLDGVYAARGRAGLAQAVSDFLAVEISGTVVLDGGACQALLRAAEPLTVTALSSVAYVDESSESPSETDILVGEHQFDASTAIAYVLGDSDRARVRREQDVAQAVLAAPEGMLREAVIAPALEDASDLSRDQIIGFIEVLVEGRERIRWDVLPTEDDEVDGVAVEQPRIVEIERLMLAIARGERAMTPADVRIAIFNGNGERLMATRTASYLEERGFVITEAANADRFTYESTYIVVLTDEAAAWLVQDTLPVPTEIVLPEELATYGALEESIPQGTDIALIAGAGMELGE